MKKKIKPFSVTARIRHGPLDVVIKARVCRDSQGIFLESCLQDTGVLLKSIPFSVTARIRHGPLDVVIKAHVGRDSQGIFLDLTRRRGDG